MQCTFSKLILSTPYFNVHVCTIFMVVVLLFMCHYCSQGAWSQHHNNWSLQRCHPGHREAGGHFLGRITFIVEILLHAREVEIWHYTLFSHWRVHVISQHCHSRTGNGFGKTEELEYEMRQLNDSNANNSSNLLQIISNVTSCHLCLPQKQSFG